MRGVVHGGQQPISGAHVYLFAANTTGYGGNGIAAFTSNASVSLLNAGYTGHSDTVGAYVLTDAGGNFSITGDYTCTAGQQVYIYALGGQPTTGVTNSVSGLMAILGSCPSAGNFLTATPYVTVNEVTTIAAAYAFAGFATDATHVSSSGTKLAQLGIANAFANATNLVNLSTGAALSTTPAGNGWVPQGAINILANILAACVNSSGRTTPCSTLLSTATNTGTSTGAQPTDTASAAINIAHYPASNITVLYGLQTTQSPFQPVLGSQPHDLTLELTFSGGGFEQPSSLAIDSAGNVWFANGYFGPGGNSLTELSPLGAAISPSTGFTGGGLFGPTSIAIDPTGNIWTGNGELNGNYGANYISKFSSSGTALSPSTGYYIGGSLYDPTQPQSIAIDPNGNVWTANLGNGTVSKFSGTALSATFSSVSQYPNAIAVDGTGKVWEGGYTLEGIDTSAMTVISTSGGVISPAGGYTGGGLAVPTGIALAADESVWITDKASYGTLQGSYRVTHLDASGAAISPATGYTVSYIPSGIAIDGAGQVWVGDYGNALYELSSAGNLLSPSNGYGYYVQVGQTPYGPDGVVGVAVDPSGNVWVANSGGENNSNGTTEFVGLATPVVTPLVANLILPYSAPASKP
jgi:sugar lactone lactonase YvrE